jgi:2-polyprenyl-3-methyl-5-hydroxy-6-metoxy-1,4-benzoquinol methylase
MLRELFFHLIYYGRPVWDTGITPPELLHFIATHTSGRALDLGCGSGTNVITLAKSGWQTTGVDFSPRAIHLAKKKAKQNGVEVELIVDDVRQLRTISGSFDLILDIGCFHSLSPDSHVRYILNIQRLLNPQGTYLLYAFIVEPGSLGPGVTEESIRRLIQMFRLVNRQDGTDRGIRSSAWFTFQKLSMV